MPLQKTALLNEFSAILTAKLAEPTAVLLILATPLAWWLAHSNIVKTRGRGSTALPLVMLPTVLGFYLLLLFSPDNPLSGLGSSRIVCHFRFMV